ncbi:CvpA family protein [Lachnospiraceae bacterium MD1]|jgi:uncharacterized membrane protein required for colicin V production|uniref:CvpA family protein n=1 Tax=Variimorphobacter saccharofermentans TaxID=2755051 RepID=A0A839K5J3_9FIRM|nr:CvpA family protein [Variimorphobacter saccharofermentans]MBB2184597.1 CvpA family protein [Variimorphobacter saccharofermentans]
MNIMLLIIVIILAVNTLIGLKVGFIKTVFSLFSMLLAITLTTWISPLVNDFMRGNDKIYNTITSKVDQFLSMEEEEVKSNEEIETIEGLRLPQSLKDSLIENNNKEIYKALAIDNFKDYINNYLAGVIVNALSFVITFFVIMAFLWALCIALDLISKLPLLNGVNKTAGLLAGLLHGLVIVWVFFLIITVFGGTKIGQQALEMIGESEILSFIYNNNLLLKFITSATKMLL